MKMFVILFLLFMSVSSCFAQDYNIQCPRESLSSIEGESIIKKVTGLSFTSKKIAEIIIQSELNRALSSGFKADLEIFNIKRLKQGEFKSLTIENEQIKYRALSLSDFSAQTLCPFNSVIYQNKRIYYSHDIPFKFSAVITNEDIQHTLMSDEFQKELNKVNQIQGFEISTPLVEIKDNYIYFSLPVKTFLSKNPFHIKLKADLEVENNKLVLKNIKFISRSNIINISMLSSLINCLNPLAYEFNTFSSKYFKMDLTNAKIIDNKIKANGIFIINRNLNSK